MNNNGEDQLTHSINACSVPYNEIQTRYFNLNIIFTMASQMMPDWTRAMSNYLFINLIFASFARLFFMEYHAEKI